MVLTFLVRESIPPEKLMGRPMCMFQFTRIFNSCVVPGEDMDELRSYPNTHKHIIVLRNNAMWSLQVLNDKGEMLPLAEILQYVVSCKWRVVMLIVNLRQCEKKLLGCLIWSEIRP